MKSTLRGIKIAISLLVLFILQTLIVPLPQKVMADDQPLLSVTPAFQDVLPTSGTTSFEVANSGTGTMSWTATSNDSWLTIVSGDSGTDSGTITVSYDSNSGDARIDTIIVI